VFYALADSIVSVLGYPQHCSGSTSDWQWLARQLLAFRYSYAVTTMTVVLCITVFCFILVHTATTTSSTTATAATSSIAGTSIVAGVAVQPHSASIMCTECDLVLHVLHMQERQRTVFPSETSAEQWRCAAEEQLMRESDSC
jgi:hypothetical protein